MNQNRKRVVNYRVSSQRESSNKCAGIYCRPRRWSGSDKAVLIDIEDGILNSAHEGTDRTFEEN